MSQRRFGKLDYDAWKLWYDALPEDEKDRAAAQWAVGQLQEAQAYAHDALEREQRALDGWEGALRREQRAYRVSFCAGVCAGVAGTLLVVHLFG